MGKRRSSRELALKFLYQHELNEGDVDEQMGRFLEQLPSPNEVKEFAVELVQSVLQQKSEIDKVLEKYSDNWVLDRMTVIDRNILRIGTCELLYNPSTPPKVAINEAVEIAKKYGNENSPEFINGILDKVYKENVQKGLLSSPG